MVDAVLHFDIQVQSDCNAAPCFGLFYAISKGYGIINAPTSLAEARYQWRVRTASGPFFHKLADEAQEGNRTVKLYGSWYFAWLQYNHNTSVFPFLL